MKTIWLALIAAPMWLLLIWVMTMSGGAHIAQLLILAGLAAALVMSGAAALRRWRARQR